MATPLAISPSSSPSPGALTGAPARGLPASLIPTALSLLASGGAGGHERASLAGQASVELAWLSSLEPVWMLRLAWMLGLDRRLLISRVADRLDAALAALSDPGLLPEGLAAVRAWVVGECELGPVLAFTDGAASLGVGGGPGQTAALALERLGLSARAAERAERLR